MDRLWAPWRSTYIGAPAAPGCFLCAKPQETNDEANYIIRRGKLFYVLLNAFPYNNGHLMLAPYRHVGDFEALTMEELAELGQLLQETLRLVKQVYHPHALNVGMNLGKAAGAGVPGHLHVHIVPRWDGDTNFMPVIGETKVISESLAQSYAKLKAAME